jgi:hypothetical protein
MMRPFVSIDAIWQSVLFFVNSSASLYNIYKQNHTTMLPAAITNKEKEKGTDFLGGM